MQRFYLCGHPARKKSPEDLSYSQAPFNRIGVYDKSGGIAYDTAAFALLSSAGNGT